ncbi:MAG: GNAT family N-acetyltransferase [Actinomycetota bacterium]
MDVEIRTIAEDEFETWMRAIESAFGSHVRPEDVQNERMVIDPARCLAAFEGDDMVGCASSVVFEMTVPGGTIPTVGITGVGVVPTHRRRGVNTALMRRQLDAIRDEGFAIAALFASEGGIYGRFGYGLATFEAFVDIETSRSAFVPGSEGDGRVRLLERDSAKDRYLSMFDESRLTRPGAMRMEPNWFDYEFAEKQSGEELKFFFAFHETGKDVDGVAVYTIKRNWSGVPQNEVELYALDALNSSAYAQMWRFVLDLDLVSKLTAWSRPVDEPLLHLVREPRRLNLRLRDAMWLRFLDIGRALSSRRYPREGRVVFDVRDAFCPWNEGRYALDSGAEGTTCEQTEDDADLLLTTNELAAVYLGGSTFSQLHRAGRVSEERAGAIGTADAMFTWDPPPWAMLHF